MPPDDGSPPKVRPSPSPSDDVMVGVALEGAPRRSVIARTRLVVRAGDSWSNRAPCVSPAPRGLPDVADRVEGRTPSPVRAWSWLTNAIAPVMPTTTTILPMRARRFAWGSTRASPRSRSCRPPPDDAGPVRPGPLPGGRRSPRCYSGSVRSVVGTRNSARAIATPGVVPAVGTSRRHGILGVGVGRPAAAVRVTVVLHPGRPIPSPVASSAATIPERAVVAVSRCRPVVLGLRPAPPGARSVCGPETRTENAASTTRSCRRARARRAGVGSVPVRSGVHVTSRGEPDGRGTVVPLATVTGVGRHRPEPPGCPRQPRRDPLTSVGGEVRRRDVRQYRVIRTRDSKDSPAARRRPGVRGSRSPDRPPALPPSRDGPCCDLGVGGVRVEHPSLAVVMVLAISSGLVPSPRIPGGDRRVDRGRGQRRATGHRA